MNRPLGLLIVLIVQVICAFFFVGQIVVTLVGIPVGHINWQIYEWIEIGAALGLILGVVLGAALLSRTLRRTEKAESKLAELSGAFMKMVAQAFDEWRLTPAERDVALFLLKGLATQEIGRLRDTSEGTVKAQTNAIYRKADGANRAQLVSHFIDDLMQGELNAAAIQSPA